MSKPRVVRCGNFPLLERSEWRRREMHPLPEQTSRIRSPGCREKFFSWLVLFVHGKVKDSCSFKEPLMSSSAR